MDFLLLDRPCLFFLYDYQYYTSHCRGIRDDFLELTPGEKCYTQEELYDQLYKILVLGSENWQKERRKIRDLAWKYQDGCACERIWEYIKKCYL